MLVSMSKEGLDESLELLHWTLHSGNDLFRSLYNEGLWMTPATASQAVENGYNLVAAWPLQGSVRAHVY